MKLLVLAALAAGCASCEAPIADEPGAFYAWDNRTVHCAVEIDKESHNDLSSILGGVDHAKDTGTVLELLVHRPGETMGWPEFEQMLSGIQERGVPFLTVTDMINGPPRAGVALMYDDAWIDTWMASTDLLTKYGAHVTLYVAWYMRLEDSQRAQLRQLADMGHDVQSHSVNHLRGTDYVDQNGLDAYINDEVMPSIEALTNDGYNITSFAYPFGMRNDEIDHAILATGQVQTLRALVQTSRFRESSCPY